MIHEEPRFPTWKGYASIKKEDIEMIKKLHFDDIDEIAMALERSAMREAYFHNMLLYIQSRLDSHIFKGEKLGLCIDSSRELFDIMIVPCDDMGFPCDDMEVPCGNMEVPCDDMEVCDDNGGTKDQIDK